MEADCEDGEEEGEGEEEDEEMEEWEGHQLAVHGSIWPEAEHDGQPVEHLAARDDVPDEMQVEVLPGHVHIFHSSTHVRHIHPVHHSPYHPSSDIFQQGAQNPLGMGHHGVLAPLHSPHPPTPHAPEVLISFPSPAGNNPILAMRVLEQNEDVDVEIVDDDDDDVEGAGNAMIPGFPLQHGDGLYQVHSAFPRAGDGDCVVQIDSEEEVQVVDDEDDEVTGP